MVLVNLYLPISILNEHAAVGTITDAMFNTLLDKLMELETGWWTDTSQAQIFALNAKVTDAQIKRAAIQVSLIGETSAQVDPIFMGILLELIRNGIHAIRAMLTQKDLDETQIIRHFHHLSQMNYGIDTGIYPLGSCTMKYNPKICEEISSWPSFAFTHPYQDESLIQGNLQIMFELERMLCEITGMDFFCLQPAAGAQGEFLGMLLTKAYHESREDNKRKLGHIT